MSEPAWMVPCKHGNVFCCILLDRCTSGARGDRMRWDVSPLSEALTCAPHQIQPALAFACALPVERA